MLPSLSFDKGAIALGPEPGSDDIFANMATLHVVGDSIPQAYYRAIKAVWEHGLAMRTQYDRKNDAGEYIDPPSRDVSVLVEIKDPFMQPRFPPISFCEVGVYIAELLGIKNHRVLPMSKLLEAVQTGGQLPTTEWPYVYSQRLLAHPDVNGKTTNQLALAVDTIVQVPFSRRAMCSTAVPDVDPYMKEDIPCWRELQLRCTVNPDDSWNFCPRTMWRSRDLYKAWGDNVIAVTFLLQTLMREISEKAGRVVHFGTYADYSCSLHVYGQDFGAVGGDNTRGLKSFFDTFPDEETFIARSLPSNVVAEMLVVPQLQGLLTEKSLKDWKFPPEAIDLINKLIKEIGDGTLVC